jgi:hypothetical protein
MAPMTTLCSASSPSARARSVRGFQKQGFIRKGSENVVGPMPPFGEILKTDDDIWKIIAWIRLVYCERHPAAC